MTTHADIVTRWAERVTNPDLRERSSRRARIIPIGDVIYSYGTHFTLAQVFRHANGKPRFVLLNGDRVSVSTSGHQSAVRSALAKIAPDVPRLVIPFSALNAAGIDHSSIVPIDVRADGYEWHRHESDTLPANAELTPLKDVYWGDDWEQSGFSRLRKAFDVQYPTDPDTGETMFQSSEESRDAWVAFMDAVEPVLAVPDPGQGNRPQEVRKIDGRYVWHTSRHWLGDALFAARTHGRRRRVKFLSSFDRNEPNRLYFLCELPATSAATIDDALEALKPDVVKLAEAMGRDCVRQGDIFAVPMPGLTRRDLRSKGATIVRRSDAAKGRRIARKADALLATLTRADDVLISTPDRLRGRDPHQWWGGLQRHMDRQRVTSRHRDAKWRELLTRRGREAVEQAAPLIPAVSLLGTAHTATEVATMPDGTQYARGIMYHDPELMGEARERDHVRRKMGDGDTWHLIAKNTVPVR